MLLSLVRGPHHMLRSSRISTSRAKSRRWSTLTTDEISLTVHSLKTSFPYIWLRDSCQSSACIHPSTSQKLHRTSDIPLDIRPINNGIRLTDDGIHIEWTDGHKSFFHASFLERHSSPDKLSAFDRDTTPIPWGKSVISNASHLFTPYESLNKSTGLLSAITQISKYGLLFVSGVPTIETSNEACELRALAELFGYIRPTFYGPLWDVVNICNSRNIAYTDLDLGLHMDLMYFQNPPQYQLLHCLRNRVEGGISTFVDGFHAASILRHTAQPSHFELLAMTPVTFHYINDGHHLHYSHPTIELSKSNPSSPEGIGQINYSPPFQAPLPLSTPTAFYPAMQDFTRILNNPENTYQHTLREGDAVIFDNRRVLHARTAFFDVGGRVREGEANRWLKGCYLESDSLKDRGRVLSAKVHG